MRKINKPGIVILPTEQVDLDCNCERHACAKKSCEHDAAYYVKPTNVRPYLFCDEHAAGIAEEAGVEL